jgi:oxygen-independent coproporphyrinogen-3 oxidase
VERLVREFILQLKAGHVSTGYFEEKYKADILKTFAEPLRDLKKRGFLIVTENDLGTTIELTRAGLLCVDRLLPEFYQAEFKDLRYT